MTDTRELSREAQAAKLLLDAVNEKFDDDDDVALTVVEGETSLFEAIDGALERLTVIEAHVGAIRESAARLGMRAGRLRTQADRIEDAIASAMDMIGSRKLERPTATLSLAKSPDKAIITAEEQLPSGFLVEKTEIKPDKKAILAVLKTGAEVPGAILSNGGVSLRILTR